MPWAAWLMVWALAGGEPGQVTVDALRLNQIQVVGTHNSYHLKPPGDVYRAVVSVQPAAREWDYSRETLDVQLDRGVRNFEIDLHLWNDEWRVLHVPMLDAETTVETLREALITIRDWATRHPRHVPISCLLELKPEGVRMVRDIRSPKRADLEAIDAIIREVFSPEQLLTPDNVRGTQATLPASIAADGWPSLAQSAGRVMFILHETGEHRRAYLEDHTALEGRAMFVNSTPGEPHAATIVLDNPHDPRLDELAREGYLIRTRVDSQRNISAARREQALAGGAHLLTTDYPLGEVDPAEAFALPDNVVARPNPITAPAEFQGLEIKEPLPEAATF